MRTIAIRTHKVGGGVKSIVAALFFWVSLVLISLALEICAPLENLCALSET